MATINGKNHPLDNLSLVEIAQLVVAESGTTDGTGIILQLRLWEESRMMDEFDFDLAPALERAIKDALLEKFREDFEFEYKYSEARFTT